MGYEEEEYGQRPHGPRELPEVKEPYPEIRVEDESLYYAHILMDDYAGVVSEITAIMLYFYHYLDAYRVAPDYAELAESISIVEMRHMEILGKLIRELGGNPTYVDSCRYYWNARYVQYYPGRLCKQIRADIEAERKAIKQYREHIELIDDRYVKAILERIIKDEQLHLKLFLEKYNKYCEDRT